MLLLQLLPLELFLEVLHLLERQDLQTLQTMPEFKDTLEPLIYTITEQESNKERLVIPRGSIFALFDTADPTKCKHNLDALQKSNLDVHLNITTSYVAEGHHVFFAPDLMKFLYRYEFHTIRFVHVTMLSVAGVRLDPRVLRLPKVKSLTLLECFVKGAGMYKFDFPSLEELKIKGHFDQINKSLVYESLSLQKLELIDTNDVEVWEGVKCPSLSSLKISKTNSSRFGMKKVGNMVFENLQVFDTSSADVESFSNLMLGKVEQWNICGAITRPRHREFYFNENVNPCNIRLHQIDAPCLRKLAIGFDKSFDVTKVFIPSLESVWLTSNHLLTPDDASHTTSWEWVNRPIELYVSGCETILKYVPLIKQLELGGGMLLERNELPCLETLIVHVFDELEHNHDFGFNDKVRYLTLLLDVDPYEDYTDCVYEWFPNLEKLTHVVLPQCMQGMNAYI